MNEDSYVRPGMSEAERTVARHQFYIDRLQLEVTLMREREHSPERWEALTMLAASAEECSLRASAYLDLFKGRNGNGLGG